MRKRCNLQRALLAMKALLWLALILLLSACSATQTVSRGSPRPHNSVLLREPAAASANAVAFRALSLVGTPYVYGGESPQVGFDCSGFVRYIYRDALGLVLARTAQAQSEFGGAVYQQERLRLGDLVFFAEGGEFGANVSHVGLYVGEGRFVHAPRTGKNVQLSSLSNSYWRERFFIGRRVL
jgi:cell wall-associated NlpC family hydrolase